MKTKLRLLVGLLLLATVFISCSKGDDEPEVNYTVTFNADGGTPAPQSQAVKAGEKATAPTNPTKQNYVFLFWHLSGSTTAYNFATPVTSNITLQAKWESEAVAEYWQVSWELSGGTWPATGDNHAVQVVKGGTLAEPAPPTKTGKTFDGWYKEAALTNKINFPYSVSAVTANFTLYAKWSDPTAEYWNITWELNGGAWPTTGDNHVDKVEKGSGLIEPAAPAKTGNTFAGWYKDAAFTNKVTFPTTVTSNFKLYAKWTAEGGYRMFTSVSTLAAWLESQPDNTMNTVYKIGLKDVNLDSGNNWGDLGIAIAGKNGQYIDLDLSSCTSTAIPDGYWSGLNVYGVFVGCQKLMAIKLPAAITSIGKHAFYSCKKLNTVVLPQQLKTIGESAFYYTELTSVVLPEGVQSIGRKAFSMCEKLESINLPEGIHTIGKEAFLGCNFTSIILPKKLKTIETSVFYGCENLTAITLPEELITIGESAFTSCKKLESIVLPASVESIGESAFKYCQALSNVTLSTGLKNIEREAFNECVSLISIKIPKGVTSIKIKAFYFCTRLTEVVMQPTVPPADCDWNFDKCSDNLKIKVPEASVNNYKTAAGWSRYASKIEANTN